MLQARSTRNAVLTNNRKETDFNMSNKKYKHTALSDTHKCRVCGKAIKKRLIEIKTVKPTLCYKHYKEKSRLMSLSTPSYMRGETDNGNS